MRTPFGLEVGDGGLEVLDLEGDRVHATTVARDELTGRAVDHRLADFDGVVTDPGHPAPPSDAGLGGLAVLEHAEPRQGAETSDGQVVVGHHGRGVEEPAHGVASHGYRPLRGRRDEVIDRRSPGAPRR